MFAITMNHKTGLLAAVCVLSLSWAAQGDILEFDATLSGANENTPNQSPGTGLAAVFFDTLAQTLRVKVAFANLTTPNTACHIHAATATAGTGNAGVATTTPTFTGFPGGVTSGTYDHTFDLTQLSSYNAAFVTANGGTASSAEAALVAALMADTSYLNIHTLEFPGGEIRGFLSRKVPETPKLALNVNAVQRSGTRLVDITYDVFDGSGDLSVSVSISTDGGISYPIVPDANSLSGDVGGVTTPGSKQITWDTLQSLPSNFSNSKMRVRLATTIGTSSSFIDSANFVLTDAPLIVTQPLSQFLQIGATATFSVFAVGQAPLNYQWYFNGKPIVGATTLRLTVNNIGPAKEGEYSVSISNGHGSVNSVTAILRVGSDPAKGTPPVQVARPQMPPQLPGANNLVLVTHGWEVVGTDPTWVDTMASTIR
jgi:hypothetical protein